MKKYRNATIKVIDEEFNSYKLICEKNGTKASEQIREFISKELKKEKRLSNQKKKSPASEHLEEVDETLPGEDQTLNNDDNSAGSTNDDVINDNEPNDIVDAANDGFDLWCQLQRDNKITFKFNGESRDIDWFLENKRDLIFKTYEQTIEKTI